MPDDLLHEHSHAQNRFAVIPTAEKLSADKTLTGKGVTIAFLDSGFYPHPDLIDRVVAFHDVTDKERDIHKITDPKGHHWHGTQTVVACAGDGSLSDGIYCGLARDARLVLVKVSDEGRIPDSQIEAGLQWIIANRERHNIRVLNMSLGADNDLPTAESCINRLTEELVAKGVVVTVAAGNSSDARSVPPANSPSVITVGGFSDENQFDNDNFDLYHSNFGHTIDGIVKPEVIAPAMYVAAPILPETDDYAAAEALSMLAAAPNYEFRRLLKEHFLTAGLSESTLALGDADARIAVENELSRRKIVATHYQHVDGTSFAAPITASVAAQMIEANPALTPAAIKNILMATAKKLSGQPSVRQGYGIIDPSAAVSFARNEQHTLEDTNYFPPRIDRSEIVFCYHDDAARSVELCGDLNEWRRGETMFAQNDDGLWTAAIPCQPTGTYRYKFVVDGHRWIEDPSHGFKESDGLGGFNSLLSIK